jgi:hypothetical protein
MGGSSTSPLSPGGILNGIATNFVAGGNPITGAMLNAAAFLGSGGFGSSQVGSGASGFPISPDLGGNQMFGAETLGNVWQGVKSANEWMNQNPTTSNIGFKLASSLLSPEEQQMKQIGASAQRGGQIQPVDYMSLLNPQQQTVIRPATPSLI